MIKRRRVLNKDNCQYCEGKGYFQLLLGGSETCGYCMGEGKVKKKVNV